MTGIFAATAIAEPPKAVDPGAIKDKDGNWRFEFPTEGTRKEIEDAAKVAKIGLDVEIE